MYEEVQIGMRGGSKRCEEVGELSCLMVNDD